MGDSLIIDWINENENRSYPLQYIPNSAGSALDNVILDAAIFYDGETIHNIVYLTEIEVSGNDRIIKITGQPNFTAASVATATYPLYIRNSKKSLLVIGSGIKDIAETTVYENVRFEGSVCYFFTKPWRGVSSLGFNNATPLTGEIVFEEGYQFGIDVTGSVIELDANRNKGEPIGCTKFFNSIPDDCSSIISFMNGVGVVNQGDNFQLVAGPNISIFNDPENHRIYIGLNFEKDDVCETPLPRPHATLQL